MALPTAVLHPPSPASASLGWWGWKMVKHTCICEITHEQVHLRNMWLLGLPSKKRNLPTGCLCTSQNCHRICKAHWCLNCYSAWKLWTFDLWFAVTRSPPCKSAAESLTFLLPVHWYTSTDITLLLLTHLVNTSYCSGKIHHQSCMESTVTRTKGL